MQDAFISYSRKDIDFVRRLEKNLREFKPPRDLNVPQRYIKVFRDEADFTGADYFHSLERHLADSAKLIVVCSPEARASTYVNDEIRRFAQTRGAENIIPILLDGIPNNDASPGRDAELAFPDALCEALKMPLAVPYSGFNAKKDRVDKGAFADSWFSLLANVYGISRADIERRERRRQARNRRITVGIVSAVITALAFALVVSLVFWGQAVEQRGIAEKALDQERAAKEKERDARLAEEAQRKLAEERRQEAERQRAAAVREAIAARSQMASRVAVQALEKLDGAPEKALNLGITAVETFHRHGDPLVPSAIGALQKINLAFAASRAVFPWSEKERSVVVHASLEWAAASDRSGAMLFARTGSADPRPIAPPRQALARGERWAAEEAKLLFTDNRLIAAMGVVAVGTREIKRGLIVSWPLSAHGLEGNASVVASFSLDDLRAVKLVASADGRWLFWTDGWHRGFLQRIDAPGTAVLTDCSWYPGACKVKAFSPDSRMFFVQTASSIRRYTLADVRATEQPPAETEIGEPADLAVVMHRDPAGKSDKETVRVAILGVRGTVEWFDMSEPAPERHPLPDIFSPYKKDLEVYGVDREEVRSSLQWRAGGEGILVSIAEAKDEFGIAAFHDLKNDSAWQPIEHRYETKALETISKTRGILGVGRRGFSVKNAANLGVSSAMWVTHLFVMTVGFDGTVLAREVDEHAHVSQKFELVATGATCAIFVGKWVALGKRDGKLDIIDIDRDREDKTVLTLNGHGAPLREIRADLDPYVGITRMLSTDTAGVTRIWDMSSPIARVPINNNMYFSDVFVTPDWNWLVKNSGKDFWPLRPPDPMWAPEHPPALTAAKAVAWNSDRSRVATLQTEPGAIVVRLWSFLGARPWRAPLVERRFPMEKLGSHSQLSLRLATTQREARLLIERSEDYKQEGLWATDLLQPRQPLRRLGGSDLSIRDASPDLQWLVVSRSQSKRTKAVELVHLAEWARAPNYVPIRGLEIDSVSGWSADGRWLALSGRRVSEALPSERFPPRHQYVIDLAAAVISGRTDQRAETAEGTIIFAYGLPPMVREGGTLQVWESSTGSRPRFVKLPQDTRFTCLAWDDAGQWFAVARDDRVWLARSAADNHAAGIGRQIQRAVNGEPLPASAEPEARAKIRSLFPFPSLGWVVAETENHHILIWHRGADGAWEQPFVFTRQELRIDYLSNVRFRPDGRMALFGDQVMSFDPEHLITYSRRLLAGRTKK